jgi:hypothetical protein
MFQVSARQSAISVPEILAPVRSIGASASPKLTFDHRQSRNVAWVASASARLRSMKLHAFEEVL